ncbi:cobalt ECF transporter T component CbiQ [Methanobacterium sp. ACI-7]|uniref:cobalt ECF transporter T component CbiQ n=1 Tax=unclassified Methanobacterium TaxID=2627676 RepID=UPI0039C42FF5
MANISTIEREASKTSTLHSLDGRIKIISSLLIIVYAVYTTNLIVLAIMELYLILLILMSHISLSYAFKRIALILPFGGAIAFFQLFIKEGTVIYTMPLGIEITQQGLDFGLLLLSRIIICVTAIVLLSSVTPMQDLINSARKLGVPREFSMLLSLTLRYLFFFYEELKRIRNAQKTRCFDIRSKKTAYIWRLKKVGETISMMFLRSYEQGEKVYFSMLSRGYSESSNLYNDEKKLSLKDYTFISITLCLIISLEIIHYFSII